jgi:hypothetical protein
VGSEKLKVLHQMPGGMMRRWSAFHESAYMRLFNGNKINGWLKVGRGCCCLLCFSAWCCVAAPLGFSLQVCQQQQWCSSLAQSNLSA